MLSFRLFHAAIHLSSCSTFLSLSGKTENANRRNAGEHRFTIILYYIFNVACLISNKRRRNAKSILYKLSIDSAEEVVVSCTVYRDNSVAKPLDKSRNQLLLNLTRHFILSTRPHLAILFYIN